jgi:hypothetical protein
MPQRTSIKPFYISFVLAPLASNASELLAAYKFALKKTKKTITVCPRRLFPLRPSVPACLGGMCLCH